MSCQEVVSLELKGYENPPDLAAVLCGLMAWFLLNIVQEMKYRFKLFPRQPAALSFSDMN